MELDKYQLAAVQTDFPKVLVASGAGAGKTRVIVERIKFLLSNGYEARNIYAITYTNAAAEEMKKRIGNNADCFAGTIHSLANRILIQNGIDTSWMVQSENFDLLFEAFKNPDNTIILPEIDYLLVDEFQDICDHEYEFIFDILRPKEYLVVGDAQQAIFGFKGSNYEYFMQMVNDPEVKVYELNNCYRCGYEILEFAETFLYTVNDVYKIPMYSQTGTIGNVVKETFSMDELLYEIENSFYSYKDIFILVRSNKEIEDIKFILDREEIPNDTFKKSDLDTDSLNDLLQKDSVKILTVHSAKGLEAKKVIVCSFKMWNSEERRVAYVAATRAKDELVWLTPKKKSRRKTVKTKLMEW